MRGSPAAATAEGSAARAEGTAAGPERVAGEARLALGVDLAAVELAALGRVAEDLVGGVDLGEGFLRLGVVAVLVGVVLLRQPPERLLDVVGTRRLADAENVVGVAHRRLPLSGSRIRVARGRPVGDCLRFVA